MTDFNVRDSAEWKDIVGKAFTGQDVFQSVFESIPVSIVRNTEDNGMNVEYVLYINGHEVDDSYMDQADKARLFGAVRAEYYRRLKNEQDRAEAAEEAHKLELFRRSGIIKNG